MDELGVYTDDLHDETSYLTDKYPEYEVSSSFFQRMWIVAAELRLHYRNRVAQDATLGTSKNLTVEAQVKGVASNASSSQWEQP